VRFEIPSELSTWLRERIVAYVDESPERLRWLAVYAARAGALPLSVGWFETIGLRPDGELVSWSTEGEYPGTRPVEDRYLWLSSLVGATKKYPRLRILLPERPKGARDCRHLAHPVFAEGKVYCPECDGLGWVEASDAESVNLTST
jgi:hypothetical protein